MNAGIVHGPRAFVRYSPPVFGVAFAALLPRHRRAVLRNLRLALGPRNAAVEARDVARVFATYASCLTSVPRQRERRRPEGRVRARWALPGAGAGKGVILAIGAHRRWQVAGPVLHRATTPAPRGHAPRRDAKAQALQDWARSAPAA
jgi:KDO2-lipid IV(A) lauroyltransferase